MTFDGLVTSDDATYVIFEIFKVFLFETEALRALAQGESSTSIGTKKPQHQILSVRPFVKIITFHRLASEGVTSLWRGGSLNVAILI